MVGHAGPLRFQAIKDFRLKPSVLQYTQLLQSLGGEARALLVELGKPSTWGLQGLNAPINLL